MDLVVKSSCSPLNIKCVLRFCQMYVSTNNVICFLLECSVLSLRALLPDVKFRKSFELSHLNHFQHEIVFFFHFRKYEIIKFLVPLINMHIVCTILHSSLFVHQMYVIT